MKLSQIRGALLEEIVINLLEYVGYKIIKSASNGIRNGRSGLEVRGRGEWHQIDAIAELIYIPAFMYPLRLLIEAKCYKDSRPVKIETPRNSLGVLKDIQENYFTYRTDSDDELQVQRYNYHSAIFSTSDYTIGAQRFAIAHQIFLITYEHVPLMQPIAKTLMGFGESDFIQFESIESIKSICVNFSNKLQNQDSEREIFSDSGSSKIESIRTNLESIRGSYFGMLQDGYPLHLLSEQPLPIGLFSTTDEIECEVYSYDRNVWYFSPSNIDPNSSNYFKLQFYLPKEIASVMNSLTERIEIANLKRERLSYIHISGKIGSVQRMVKLKLDENWLSRYLEGTAKHF